MAELITRSILLAAGHLLLLALLAATAFVLGRELTRRLPYRDAGEAAAFSTALGLGALGWLLFLLALAGWLTREAILGLGVAVHLGGFRVWRRAGSRARRLIGGWRGRPRHPRRLRHWLLAGLFLAVLLPAALLPLYPPTEPDATAYHLPFAATYLAGGGLVFAPTLRFPVFPVLNEMLFAAMMSLAGDTAAHLVHFLEMLLTAALLAAWGRRLLSRRAGVWGSALWLGTPLVVWMAGAAYVDLGLALFATASILAWEIARDSSDRRWLWLAGASAGLAAGTKYLGLFFVAGIGLLLLWDAVRRRRAGDLAAFSAAALMALGPWYLWIWHQTGSPFFPYYPQLFGDSEWLTDFDRRGSRLGDAGRSALDLARHALGEVAAWIFDLVRVPYAAVFRRQVFRYQAPGSPLLLLLLPAAIPALLRGRTRRPLLWVLGYGLLWRATIPDLRFLLAVLPALAIGLTGALDRAVKGRFAGRFFDRPGSTATILVTALLLAPGAFYAGYKISERGLPPATPDLRQLYLLEQRPGYAAIDLLNRRHGGDYTVYVLWGTPLHHFAEGRFLGARIGPYRHRKVLRAMGDSRKLHRRLRSFGAEYFLILRKRAARLPEDRFFPLLFETVLEEEDFSLYRLAPPGRATGR